MTFSDDGGILYRVTQKTGTFEKPNKIEEMQQKNFIDTN